MNWDHARRTRHSPEDQKTCDKDRKGDEIDCADQGI